ncbi:MAG: sigma-70 family RNA polymerase sigma factor [Planctomycetota bacterium]|nr:sigma-70 family RNA polymerase sigma factor [Planctomycetota bacterium]
MADPVSTSGSGGKPPAEALKALLAYRPYLLAFLMSMVRDFEFAEELYQDICVAACERWDRRAPDADFGAWVREIARRRTMAALKARAKAGQQLPSEKLIDEFERAIASMTASPQERWEARKEALRACYKALPAHLRQVLELRYAQKLSCAQIAEKLGKEAAAVAELLAAARTELDACLAQKRAFPEAEGSA